MGRRGSDSRSREKDRRPAYPARRCREKVSRSRPVGAEKKRNAPAGRLRAVERWRYGKRKKIVLAQGTSPAAELASPESDDRWNEKFAERGIEGAGTLDKGQGPRLGAGGPGVGEADVRL